MVTCENTLCVKIHSVWKCTRRNSTVCLFESFWALVLWLFGFFPLSLPVLDWQWRKLRKLCESFSASLSRCRLKKRFHKEQVLVQQMYSNLYQWPILMLKVATAVPWLWNCSCWSTFPTLTLKPISKQLSGVIRGQFIPSTVTQAAV